MCGGPPAGRTLKACIPGGSSVPILTREETEATLLDYEGVVAQGSMLGSGGVIVFDELGRHGLSNHAPRPFLCA